MNAHGLPVECLCELGSSARCDKTTVVERHCGILVKAFTPDECTFLFGTMDTGKTSARVMSAEQIRLSSCLECTCYDLYPQPDDAAIAQFLADADYAHTHTVRNFNV